jgi:taurine--2-oxoglutarate transaminase
MANEASSRLAEMLVQVAPEAMTSVFFTLGGAEANEHAIRMAQVFTGKHKILSRYRSYHGATLGAISASGDPRRFGAEPIPAGFVHVPDCYCYRCPFEKSNPECDLLCARHIETVIELEGDIAAVLIEPIVGANGLLIPPPGYIRMIKEICDRHGVLLIADEVMTGFGRTGRWFACEHDNVVPDLMSLAKGLTSGYVPLGAVILASHVADFFQDRFLPSGLTYSSHPLSCAAGVAVLEVMKDEKLVENSERLGRFLHAELDAIKDRHPCVGDVRNLGLFGCIELVADRERKTPLVPWNSTGSAARPTLEMSKYLMSKGIMPRIRWNYFNIGPPLITTEEELKWVLHTVDEALSITDENASK